MNTIEYLKRKYPNVNFYSGTEINALDIYFKYIEYTGIRHIIRFDGEFNDVISMTVQDKGTNRQPLEDALISIIEQAIEKNVVRMGNFIVVPSYQVTLTADTFKSERSWIHKVNTIYLPIEVPV